MKIENSTFVGVTSMSVRRSGVGRRLSQGGGNQGPMHQRHKNWEQAKMLAFI
jgi:hypothetical protein